MNSENSVGGAEEEPTNTGSAVCKRPGCGNPLPTAGRTRGRTRQFCSNECARRYHNDARIPAPRSAPAETGDPLAALDTLIRQVAVLVRAARDQVVSLDATQVRAQIAEAEAARRRAEASAAAAASRAAQAQSQVQALTSEVQTLRQALEGARQAEADARAEAARAQAEGD